MFAGEGGEQEIERKKRRKGNRDKRKRYKGLINQLVYGNVRKSLVPMKCRGDP